MWTDAAGPGPAGTAGPRRGATTAVRAGGRAKLVAMLLNVYATHRRPPALDVPHRLLNRRDRSDPELVNHLQGFMGYVMRGERPMTQPRYHVLRHIGRVQHHLSLEIDEGALDRFAAWARAANAIVFTVDGDVCDPDGGVLVDAETGEPEAGAAVPYPDDAIRRKQATTALLRERGVPTAAGLPPVVSEVEVDLRSPDEVARRCLALFACAVRAESIAGGEPIPLPQLRQRLPLAFEAMSPTEQAFMADPSPDQQAIVNHTWRYEALAVLRWALGSGPALGLPSDLCDVSAVARAMLDTPGADLLASARLRPTAELLDALDLTYRLAWAVTDARVNDHPPLDALEPGVVAERHYALNWLTRFGDADWDDVETPT